MATEDEVTFEESSGNVFADLGLPDAEKLHAKMGMIVTISRTLEARGLSRRDAAKVLGTTQRNLAKIYRYEIDEFSIEQLIQFASSLEYRVIVELRPRDHAGKNAVMDVHAA